MTEANQILVIDEGTTSTRAMLFALDGKCLGSAQEDLTQYYPAPGFVEHDANEIWDKTLKCAQSMVAKADGAAHIAAIGITNQRETIVAWDKRTGEPLCHAIVWQDRRTASTCDALKAKGHEKMVQTKTGLLLDSYFSASKMAWMLENIPAAKSAGDALAFGTIESWLIWKLTGGLHITDASNASRTMLLALDGQSWDSELAALFDIPLSALPKIVDNIGDCGKTDAVHFGQEIAICGAAGDQQAATIGQACLNIGDTKATFGTGAFVLTNSGTQPPKSANRLLSTILYQIGGVRHYALEGSIFVAGSLMQWLRDELGLIGSASESEGLARSVPDNGGCYLVPALSGLGAPHWRPEARGLICGLSFATTKAHIVRAALEAQSYQTHDLMTAFVADGIKWAALKIDGGMVRNNWLAQDLADILQLPVERPEFVETTALGAAMLAAVGAGLYPDLTAAAQAMRGAVEPFSAAIEIDARAIRLAGWANALNRV